MWPQSVLMYSTCVKSVSAMREVGVRELKASLSELLQLASRGGRVRVTVHGRPVADIVPTGADEDALGSLIDAGRLLPPSRPRPKRAPPLVPASGSASGLVLSERDAERDGRATQRYRAHAEHDRRDAER